MFAQDNPSNRLLPYSLNRLREWFFYFAQNHQDQTFIFNGKRPVGIIMAVKADLYEIILFFPRLFPDPAVFEDPVHLANRYFFGNGLSREKSDLIYQSTDEILPVDSRRNPASASGTAKYAFEGKIITAEYMSDAYVRLAYTDFGTGLAADDHSRLWNKGKLGELRFQLREFRHQSTTLNIPDISDLYQMLKERATPDMLSTIELGGVSGQAFQTALAYIEGKLSALAKADHLEVEVYAARDLSASEKGTLEKRIGRESTGSTIFVILSRLSVPELHSTLR